MKKSVYFVGILLLLVISACSEAPQQKKIESEKVEMSEEDKALEKEMQELDEDVEALETLKK